MSHPSWILYQCDRTTPAWYTGLVGRNVPLDVTNPEVIAWQASRYAAPAAAAGYDAIAADMFIIHNAFKACGVWQSPGVWKQLYAPAVPGGSTGRTTDRSVSVPGSVVDFASAQVSWLDAFRRAIASYNTRTGQPMGLIPNFAVHACGLVWNDPLMERIRNSTTGVLDEAGFTGWGSQRSADPEWSNIVMYALDLQQHGKR